MEAGNQILHWDGADELGHAVGAGVYWMKIMSGSNEAIRKVVKLR